MFLKMLSKIAYFLEHRFGRVLGKVLGGFWEAKILDFRSFFDIFSMRNFDCNSRGEKIEKNDPKYF